MSKAPSPSLSNDAWLGTMLGVPVYSVSGGPGKLPPSVGPRFLFAKVNVADAARSRWLENEGFDLISETVTLKKIVDGKATPHPSCRRARSSDENAVAAIARGSFALDRFHRDPSISAATSDRIKESWARNFFKGERGDEMIVAEDANGKVMGFLQIMCLEAATNIIDLIAIDPAARGKGLGLGLILTMEAAISAGKSIQVSTQIDNLVSLAMYKKTGFSVCATSRVYHRHDD